MYSYQCYILYILFCRNPGLPLSWKPRVMSRMTRSTSLQLRAHAATSCCPASAALFVVPPLGTSLGMSCASSTPCDAAVPPTSVVASMGRAHHLSHQRKESTAPIRQPQLHHQPRESRGLSKSPQSCLSQQSPVLDPQTSVPGVISVIFKTQAKTLT